MTKPLRCAIFLDECKETGKSCVVYDYCDAGYTHCFTAWKEGNNTKGW